MRSDLLDLGARTVDLETGRLDDGTVLTAIELKLLVHLVERRGRPCLAQELLRDVWGYRATRTNTVKTTMNRLRRKLGDPDLVRSARGRGYWFEGPVPKPRRASPLCVGREDVVHTVEAALDDAEVVTLVGPTGVGKTHLAEAFSKAWGAPVVRLAELHDATGLNAAAARALDCASQELRVTLARTPLVVLDNAEHLDLASAISTWPTRLLVTSQAPLGVPDERVVRLGPLPHAAALDLLVARASRSGVQLDRDDPFVARLIQQTEGLPLALELAAARLTTTGTELLAEDPGLLDPSWQATGRHSGLDAAAAWSWSLLSESARSDLARLAWFEHGFWARDVPGLLGEDGHARVHELAERSCLRAVGPGRLALFAPMRRFARRHADEALHAHERWLDAQVSGAIALRHGPESDEALQRVLALEKDLFAALERGPSDAVLDGLSVVLANSPRHETCIELARRYPRPSTRVRAAHALRHLGRFDEARRQVQGLEDWRAHRVRAVLARDAGDYAGSIACTRRALAAAEHDTVRAMVLVDLAQSESSQGADQAARALLDEALACITRSGEPRNGVLVAYAWAAHVRDRGDLDAARAGFSRAHARAVERRYPWYAATTGLGLASVLLEQGEFSRARAVLDETEPRIARVASPTLQGVALRYRALLAHLEGRLEDASETSQAAAAVLGDAGHTVQQAIALVQAALAARALGRPEMAARLLRSAERSAGSAADALAAVTLAHGRPADGGSDVRLVRLVTLA